MPILRRSAAVPALLALLLAACSSSSSGSATTSSATTSAATAPPTAAPAPACTPPTTAPARATDLGNSRDWDITSFDGTVIRAHWFPVAGASASSPAPTLLMGPGWGGAGDTDTSTPGTLGAISIRTLADHGYNVLTWDPRGFGKSTGKAEVDSPQFEARDVEQLIDWVAAQPGVQLDGVRDPRMGMVGASYGGGIQLVTAPQDCRIDALVPIIAWHSLATSLFKADTPKLGWATLLMLGAAGARLDPIITGASDSARTSGTFSAEAAAFFTDRGPADTVATIRVPTLIIQGTVDTLFTLDEAVSNYTLLQKAGTKVAMLWYCGGHGVCLTKQGDPGLVGDSATAWLDRYVKHDAAAKDVPGFQFVDQDGNVYTADKYPTDGGGTPPLSASGSGTLRLVTDGGAGPSKAKPPTGGIVSVAALAIAPAPATNAVSVKISAPATETLLVGAPDLQLTYSGTVAASDRPSSVFAQLIDDTTGLVLGNQITPIKVILDGQSHTLDVPLEMIAHRFVPGATLTLQLVATTVAYVPPRLGGSVTFSKIDIHLPVMANATRVG